MQIMHVYYIKTSKCMERGGGVPRFGLMPESGFGQTPQGEAILLYELK